MKEINNGFEVQQLENGKGVQKRLEKKLQRVIESAWPVETDQLIVKITGDGTMMGSRLHITNFGFCVITDKWSSEDMILAITQMPEKYDCIKEAMKDVVHDTLHLKSVTVRGKVFSLKYVICADLKFTNIILGLGACNSDYCCAWCKTKKCDFYDVYKTLDENEEKALACTTEEIETLSKKKSKKYEN